MKIRFLLAAVIASLLALSSCKKDDPATTPNNNNNNPQPTPSKKLKKVTETEGTNVTVYNLTYNTSDRLVSYRSSDDAKYVVFSYDAGGNLTGIEEQEEDFKNIYNYTYQNNVPATGTLKTWSLVSGQPDELIEDDQLTYTVSNNKVTNMRLEMLQAGTAVDLALTYTGNNLTRVASGGTMSYTADFSFGTHRPAYPKVSNYVLDQAGFSLLFASNNEMLSASYDFPGTALDYSINTQYTFNSDGYVLTSDDGTTQMTFEYE